MSINKRKMVENISKEQWKELIAKDNQSIVIDVRTPEEWAEGIIPGALMINVLDRASFKEEIEKLDDSKHYYVCCRAGSRSFQACNMMQEMGIERTFNLLGGMSQWDGDVVLP